MVSVAFNDRRDGSGVDVEIEGAAGSVSIYAAKFAGYWATEAFSLRLGPVGNGSHQMAIDPGAYIAVASDGGGYTALTAFRASDHAQSLHERCLVAVREFVLSMAPPGLPADPALHKIRRRPVNAWKDFGANQQEMLGVHYWPGEEERRPQSNRTETVTYPVNVVWIAGSNDDNRLDADTLLARELLSKSFPGCPLPGVDEIHTVSVVPGVIFGSSGLNVAASALTLRCETEQVGVVE